MALTVERIDDGGGFVSPDGPLRVADELELRGPIGGPSTWRLDDGGLLPLVTDGSGLVPLTAMLRPRAARSSPTAFVGRAADLLVQLGHNSRRIRVEDFGPMGG